MVDGCSMPRVSRLWPHVIFLTAAGIGGVLPKCRPQLLPVGVGLFVARSAVAVNILTARRRTVDNTE